MTRKQLACCLLLTMLSGCAWDGQFSLLGYTTRPNYDDSIQTVYVSIFGNQTFYRELEFDLTRAVIREIEAKTPYKVVCSSAGADSELLGKITQVTKTVINANQLNEIREGQMIVAMELIWRDLRPGHKGQILSANRQGGTGGPPGPPDPHAPPLPPTLVTALANFQVELGGSRTSALKDACDRLAIQVVSMMEKPF